MKKIRGIEVHRHPPFRNEKKSSETKVHLAFYLY